MLPERLKDWAAQRGYGLAVAGPGVVTDVLRKIERRRAEGMFAPGFYDENLSWIKPLERSPGTGPVGVVTVAVPSPIHVLPVTVAGRSVETLIPPTYVRYRGTFETVLADMRAGPLGEGEEAAVLKVPLKSLAVHMGLVTYGRNNLTYAPGLGSGHQLCGYIVTGGEMRLFENEAAAPAETTLARCANCRACVNVCPTGAIREDRFLISAERCFTLHSESRRPMPAWVGLPRTLCFIGCMDCQFVCPENKGRLKTVPSGVEFSSEETEAVLDAGRRVDAGVPGAGPIPPEGRRPALAAALKKFERLGLSEDFDVMGRNLGLFLKRGRGLGSLR